MSECKYVGDVENDLEVILDGDERVEVEHENGEENNDPENHESDTKQVKPKRAVKNPQFKLDEQTLKGPRGLMAIENYYDRVKFKGRGYEEEDLNILLKTYEYWCHRLFPKFPFDSCIARLEKLGTKRATQTQIKKIRMGLMNDESEHCIPSDEENKEIREFVDTYNDQFHQLVSNESEPIVSAEQLVRMHENMERAKRLREEKLEQIKENHKNNMHTQMDIDNSENIQFTNDTTPNPDNSQRNIDEVQLFDENTFSGKTRIEDEDEIENIIHYINAENNENKKSSSFKTQENVF